MLRSQDPTIWWYYPADPRHTHNDLASSRSVKRRSGFWTGSSCADNQVLRTSFGRSMITASPKVPAESKGLKARPKLDYNRLG